MATSSAPRGRVGARPIQVMPQGITIANVMRLAQKKKQSLTAGQINNMLADPDAITRGGTPLQSQQLSAGLAMAKMGLDASRSQFISSYANNDQAGATAALNAYNQNYGEWIRLNSISKAVEDRGQKISDFEKNQYNASNVLIHGGRTNWVPGKDGGGRFVTEEDFLNKQYGVGIDDDGAFGFTAPDDIDASLNNNVNNALNNYRINIEDSAAKFTTGVNTGREANDLLAQDQSVRNTNKTIREDKIGVIQDNYRKFEEQLRSNGVMKDEYNLMKYNAINDNAILPMYDNEMKPIIEDGKLKTINMNEEYGKYHKLVERIRQETDDRKRSELEREAGEVMYAIDDTYQKHLFRSKVNTVPGFESITNQSVIDVMNETNQVEKELFLNATGMGTANKVQKWDTGSVSETGETGAYAGLEAALGEDVLQGMDDFIRKYQGHVRLYRASLPEEYKKIFANRNDKISTAYNIMQFYQGKKGGFSKEAVKDFENVLRRRSGAYDALDVYYDSNLTAEEKTDILLKNANLSDTDKSWLYHAHKDNAKVYSISKDTEKYLKNKKRRHESGDVIYINGTANQLDSPVVIDEIYQQTSNSTMLDQNGDVEDTGSFLMENVLVTQEQLEKLTVRIPTVVDGKVRAVEHDLGKQTGVGKLFSGSNLTKWGKLLQIERIDDDETIEYYKNKTGERLPGVIYRVKAMANLNDFTDFGGNVDVLDELRTGNYNMDEAIDPTMSQEEVLQHQRK